MSFFKNVGNLGLPSLTTITAAASNTTINNNNNNNNTGSKGQQALLKWCQNATQGYAGVRVVDFDESWKDGLAFCALLHHFHPHLIPFSTLNSQNKQHNFQLAFKVAEDLGIPALLDVEDMILPQKPDRLSIITYLSTIYHHLNNNSNNNNKKPGGPPKTPNKSANTLAPPPPLVFKPPPGSAARDKRQSIVVGAGDENARPLCGKCQQPLSGDVVEGAGSMFHAGCFVCTTCNKQLQGRCMNVKNKPYCPPCGKQAFSSNFQGMPVMGMPGGGGPPPALLQKRQEQELNRQLERQEQQEKENRAPGEIVHRTRERPTGPAGRRLPKKTKRSPPSVESSFAPETLLVESNNNNQSFSNYNTAPARLGRQSMLKDSPPPTLSSVSNQQLSSSHSISSIVTAQSQVPTLPPKAALTSSPPPPLPPSSSFSTLSAPQSVSSSPGLPPLPSKPPQPRRSIVESTQPSLSPSSSKAEGASVNVSVGRISSNEAPEVDSSNTSVQRPLVRRSTISTFDSRGPPVPSVPKPNLPLLPSRASMMKASPAPLNNNESTSQQQQQQQQQQQPSSPVIPGTTSVKAAASPQLQSQLQRPMPTPESSNLQKHRSSMLGKAVGKGLSSSSSEGTLPSLPPKQQQQHQQSSFNNTTALPVKTGPRRSIRPATLFVGGSSTTLVTVGDRPLAPFDPNIPPINSSNNKNNSSVHLKKTQRQDQMASMYVGGNGMDLDALLELRKEISLEMVNKAHEEKNKQERERIAGWLERKASLSPEEFQRQQAEETKRLEAELEEARRLKEEELGRERHRKSVAIKKRLTVLDERSSIMDFLKGLSIQDQLQQQQQQEQQQQQTYDPTQQERLPPVPPQRFSQMYGTSSTTTSYSTSTSSPSSFLPPVLPSGSYVQSHPQPQQQQQQSFYRQPLHDQPYQQETFNAPQSFQQQSQQPYYQPHPSTGPMKSYAPSTTTINSTSYSSLNSSKYHNPDEEELVEDVDRYVYEERNANRLEGFLLKQNVTGIFNIARNKIGLGNWTKKWFTLQLDKLAYYNEKVNNTTGRDCPPDGIILLTTVDAIEPVDQQPAVVFRIVTSEETYLLEAATTEEMHLWVIYLTQAKQYYDSLNSRQQHQTNDPSMEMSGWLEKKGPFNLFYRRYFVLRNGILYRFRTGGEKDVLGKIPLYGARFSEYMPDSYESTFEIVAKDESIVLRASNDEIMHQWLNALLKQKIMIEEAVSCIILE